MLHAVRALMLSLGCLLAAPFAVAQDLPEVPPAPLVQEDAPKLEKSLKELEDLLPPAEEAIKAAQTALDKPDLPPAEKPAREADLATAKSRRDSITGRMDDFKAAITAAKQGPKAADLAARREFDALVAKARAVLAETEPDGVIPEGAKPEGALSTAIREAEEELEYRVNLTAAVDKADVRNSRVFERLSDVEKLELELRWASERFKVKIDEYDQLSGPVFAAYVAFEKRATEGLAAVEAAQAKRREFETSKAAELELPVKPATNADLVGIATAIRAQLGFRRGVRGSGPGQALHLEGRLRDIQRAIDLREDYREQLEADLEKLKDRLAKEGRTGAAAPATNAPTAVPHASEEYQRLSEQMDGLETEMQAARAEMKRLQAERATLADFAAEKLAVEQQVEADLNKRRTALDALRKANPETRGDQRNMLVFTESEMVEAVAERLASARVDTRRVVSQIEVLDRRASSLVERIAAIEATSLPETREQYWRSLGITAAKRAGLVLLVFAVAWLALWLIRRIGTPILERMMGKSDALDGNDVYRRQRSRTLFSVFMTAMRVVVYMVAAMFALAQFDVDYGPLLVAAGGVSLAIGFGAQSLVKDFFSGFFILLEGQYSIGDVVEINGKTGTVEQLGLRSTVLRSINGDVHTVPNGDITMTTNQTKIWSRAVMDVGIAYEENLDDVIGVLEAVGREMQKDEVWGRKVQDIIIPGVDSFGDNSVNVRVLLKTRAGEQWGAAREYRRRVKLKFDELGIEIPWPQRVISYKPAEHESKGETGRSKRAAMLRYVRRMRGEKEEGMAGISVEERDRAETLAKQQVAAAEQANKEDGVEQPKTPETPKSPASDAERLAQNMAERILREKEESGMRPPTRPPDPPPPKADDK